MPLMSLNEGDCFVRTIQKDAIGEATDAEWRNAGRMEAVGVALDWGGRSCSCSLNDSVDVRVLELGVLEAAYC